METQKYYQTVLDCINEHVYVRDLDMNILYINSAAERFSGWKLESVIGKKCYEVFGDENQKCRHACPVEDSINENRNILHHEGELKNSGGQIRKMRASISPMAEGGEVTGGIVVMQDITDFKDLQESQVKTLIRMGKIHDSLQKSEFYLSQAQAVAGIGSWHLDIRQDTLTWSDETCRIFGIDQKTNLNVSKFLERIHPEDRKMVNSTWNKALQGSPYDIEHRILVNDKILWVHIKAHIKFGSDKVPFEAIGTVHDITNRKQSLDRIVKLSGLSEKLLYPGSLSEKLKLVTESIVKIFKADFARIWIIKAEDVFDSMVQHAVVNKEPHSCHVKGCCLHLMASSGRYTDLDGGNAKLPFDSNKIGKIALGVESKFLTNDILNSAHIINKVWAQKLGLVSFAGYRLLSNKNRVIGVLALFSRKLISPEEDAQLENLAGVVGQVIQTTKAEKALLRERDKLKDAIAEIKTLSGLLPICSTCKKIRDDNGYWNQIESYIRAHSEAEFSHSICPECAKKMYPDLDIYVE